MLQDAFQSRIKSRTVEELVISSSCSSCEKQLCIFIILQQFIDLHCNLRTGIWKPGDIHSILLKTDIKTLATAIRPVLVPIRDKTFSLWCPFTSLQCLYLPILPLLPPTVCCRVCSTEPENLTPSILHPFLQPATHL